MQLGVAVRASSTRFGMHFGPYSVGAHHNEWDPPRLRSHPSTPRPGRRGGRRRGSGTTPPHREQRKQEQAPAGHGGLSAQVGRHGGHLHVSSVPSRGAPAHGDTARRRLSCAETVGTLNPRRSPEDPHDEAPRSGSVAGGLGPVRLRRDQTDADRDRRRGQRPVTGDRRRDHRPGRLGRQHGCDHRVAAAAPPAAMSASPAAAAP